MSATHPRRPRYTLVIMVLLSLTAITLSAKDVPVLGSVRSTVIDVFGPIGRGFRSMTAPVRNLFSDSDDAESLKAENKRLRAENDQLKAKQIRYADAEAELRRLQTQLKIGFVADIPTAVAQVATGPYTSFEDSTIIIDKGSDAGIRPQMPAVTEAGLVGRIKSVTSKRAVVQLITDPEFNVGIKFGLSGNIALGHGHGPQSDFRIDSGVELTQPVNKGEPIATSGLGRSVFPKDIPIGIVSKISTSRGEQSQVVDVRLSADLVRLNVVSVLLWEPPK